MGHALTGSKPPDQNASETFSLPCARSSATIRTPRDTNQSRYLAGVVSGIAAQSNAVAVAEATPKIKKPSQRSRPSNIKPVTAVLIEAAMAIRVPMNPRTRLKRPVPVVRSVITRIVSTVTAAALIPPRNCANSSIGPLAEPHPWRQHGNDDLRHDNQAGHE